MKPPVIVPTSGDVKPCDGRSHIFESPLSGDHAEARIHCRGSETVEPCPFIGWCIQERESFQASEYGGGLHGTWHGVLFIKGRASRKGKLGPGRPRKVAA